MRAMADASKSGAKAIGWIAASLTLSCYSGQTGGSTAVSADGGRTDAHLSDATISTTPDARVILDSFRAVDATDDTTIAIVCPTAPPVNLEEIPGLKAACTEVVLVVGGSANSDIAVSTNGSGTWTSAHSDGSGQNAFMSSFAFGYGFGLAVGGSDSLITANGTTWLSADSGAPTSGFNYRGFGFLNNMFVFVAVGEGSGYSFTGTNWTFVTNNNPYSTGALANFSAQAVTYGDVPTDGGTGRYVVVGTTSNRGPDGGTLPVYAGYRTSTDGENWSDDVALLDSQGNKMSGFSNAVTFCNGHYVLVGDGNGNPKPNADGLIAWSTDGLDWHVQTAIDSDASAHISFDVVACTGTTFIAAANIYSRGVWTSTDGETWTVNQSAAGFGQLTAFENYFIGGPVGGAAKGVVSVSSDNGQTWAMQTALTNGDSVYSVGAGRVLKTQ